MWPSMPPEPPPEFVAFVTRWLPEVRAEAARQGGDDEVYPAALADVASYWRWRRLLRLDPGTVLRRRMAVHGRRWRAARTGEPLIEMVVLRDPADEPRPGGEGPYRRPAADRAGSVALRKAALLPPTARERERPVAEAGIAWLVACRRYRWARWARTALTAAMILAVAGQLVPDPPT